MTLSVPVQNLVSIVALTSGSRYKARVLSIPPPPPTSTQPSLSGTGLLPSCTIAKSEPDLVVSEPDTSSNPRDASSVSGTYDYFVKMLNLIFENLLDYSEYIL